METQIKNNTVWMTVSEAPSVYVPTKEVKVTTRNDCKIQLVAGDITRLDTDAIVISANPYLQMCSGIARQVRELGGESIQESCDQIGYTPAGKAAITDAGALNARYVIHAVGPLGCEPDSRRTLTKAAQSCLALADDYGLKTVALPALSTDIYDYPLDKCACVMLNAVIDYLRHADTGLECVVFCLPNADTLSVFETQLAMFFETDILLDLARQWADGS